MAKSKRGYWTDFPSSRLLLTLLCCFVYLLSCYLFITKWRCPLAKTYYENEMQKEIDVVGIAVKPTCISKKAIEALNRFLGPRRIIVVTTTDAGCRKFLQFASNVECMVETNLLPNVTKDSIREFVEKTYGTSTETLFRGRDTSGWYLQQFLKMGASLYIQDLSDYHVIWDLDMILLRELSIFRPSFKHGLQTIMNIGGFNSPGYDYSYMNLTGNALMRAPDHSSFVTHWVVVYKPFMTELIYFLSSKPKAAYAPEGSPWVWAVLSALSPEYLHMGFSEYATYSSWVLSHHPESVYIMPSKTWNRYPLGTATTLSLIQHFSRNGLCCPSDTFIQFMGTMQIQYCGFEMGHNEKCRYNDPKYKDGYGV